MTYKVRRGTWLHAALEDWFKAEQLTWPIDSQVVRWMKQDAEAAWRDEKRRRAGA